MISGRKSRIFWLLVEQVRHECSALLRNRALRRRYSVALAPETRRVHAALSFAAGDHADGEIGGSRSGAMGGPRAGAALADARGRGVRAAARSPRSPPRARAIPRRRRAVRARCARTDRRARGAGPGETSPANSTTAVPPSSAWKLLIGVQSRSSATEIGPSTAPSSASTTAGFAQRRCRARAPRGGGRCASRARRSERPSRSAYRHSAIATSIQAGCPYREPAGFRHSTRRTAPSGRRPSSESSARCT